MYEAEIFGKKIKITNKQYNHLIKKFHPGNVARRRVVGLCIFCMSRCRNCAFNVFVTRRYSEGCIALLGKIIGQYGLQNCNPSEKSISFSLEENTIRRYMQKIQSVLKTFKKL